jgi:hypothetical protein
METPLEEEYDNGDEGNGPNGDVMPLEARMKESFLLPWIYPPREGYCFCSLWLSR